MTQAIGGPSAGSCGSLWGTVESLLGLPRRPPCPAVVRTFSDRFSPDPRPSEGGKGHDSARRATGGIARDLRVALTRGVDRLISRPFGARHAAGPHGDSGGDGRRSGRAAVLAALPLKWPSGLELVPGQPAVGLVGV